MVALKIAGKYPDQDTSLAHKRYVDDKWNAIKVDNAYVDTATSAVAANLVLPSYVSGQDASLAKKATVDANDANYIARSQLGVNGGIATTDSSNTVPDAQVPAGVLTKRTPFVVFGANVIATTATVVSAVNKQEYLASQLTIADPGWPYTPLFLGQVVGSAPGLDPGDGKSTGCYGQAIVYDAANVSYGRAVTSGNYRTAGFPVMPWGTSGASPFTVTGTQTFKMFFSLYSGPSSGYTFQASGTYFYAIVMPGF